MINAIIINDKVYIPTIPDTNGIHCTICDLKKTNCKDACFIFGKNYIMKEIKEFTYTTKGDIKSICSHSSTGE